MNRPYRPDTWTPDLVAEVLVEARKWAGLSAGRVGPLGFVTTRGMAYLPTLEDHLAEGWGLPETADEEIDDAERARRMRAYSTAQIALFEHSLTWPQRYLVGANPGSARMLSIWIKHRRGKRAPGFNEQVESMGISRAIATRLKDRGLSMIAQGLHRDGISLPAND